MDYLWIKALHLIAVMSWMAGLLYLPAYSFIMRWLKLDLWRKHSTDERRPLAIMNPAMILSWV